MAVVTRYYGVDFGKDATTITSDVSTTSKHLEIAINMGDPAGSTAQQAAAAVIKEGRGQVIAQLQALIDSIETGPWPPARS
jgi:hypothetical protein